MPTLTWPTRDADLKPRREVSYCRLAKRHVKLLCAQAAHLYGGWQVEDDRLKEKPKSNDGSLPIMWYDFNDMPAIARGIWEAQHATGRDGIGGWPSILTYDHKAFATMSRSSKRYGMDSAGVPSNAFVGLSRDEYPFASTVENAGSTFVTMAGVDEQAAQARMMNAFYRKHGAYKGVAGKPFYFEVKLLNVPDSLK